MGRLPHVRFVAGDPLNVADRPVAMGADHRSVSRQSFFDSCDGTHHGARISLQKSDDTPVHNN